MVKWLYDVIFVRMIGFGVSVFVVFYSKYEVEVVKVKLFVSWNGVVVESLNEYLFFIFVL